MYQPRHAWNSFWYRQFFTAVPRLFAQNMALLFFHVKMFHPCLKIFWDNNWIFLSGYICGQVFTIWKKTPCLLSNTLLCFHLSMQFSELSLLQFFAVFTVDVTIWEHCFTLLWSQISPHEVTTDSPLAEIFQPGFSSDFWTAISSSSWDFRTFYPLWRFLQPCHFGSLGVSHHGNNWRDDKK